jgi:maltose/moltooligosaccharide transporter
VFFGKLSDRVWWLGGRRRPFICIGALLVSASFLALSHLTSLQVPRPALLAALVVLLMNIAINVGFVAARALPADLTPPGPYRTKVFAWQQGISGALGVLAYVIGAVFGNEVLIVVGAIVLPIFSWIPCLMIREPAQLQSFASVEEQAEKQDIASPIRDGRESKPKQNRKWLALSANAFAWLGMQVLFIYSIAFLRERFLTESDSGRVLALGFAAMNTTGFILPPLLITRLAQRFGRSQICAFSLAITALSFLGVQFFAESSFSFFAWMALAGIGWGAMLSLPLTVISELEDPAKMGFTMGIFNISIVIPQLIASCFTPNIAAVFPIAAASLLASAGIWLFV